MDVNLEKSKLDFNNVQEGPTESSKGTNPHPNNPYIRRVQIFRFSFKTKCLLFPSLEMAIQKNRNKNFNMGKPLSFQGRSFGTTQSYNSEHTSILGFNSVYSKRNLYENKEKMSLLSLDSK